MDVVANNEKNYNIKWRKVIIVTIDDLKYELQRGKLWRELN